MAKRICLLTGNETKCTDGCYRCGCGGEVALNDCYVPIYNIQRVCDIVKNMADVSTEGEEIAEYIRNELEKMVIPAADVQPVKHGRWIDCTFYDPCEKSWEQDFEFECSNCGHKIYNKPNDNNLFCGHCSARMDGGADDENNI